jgi:hypothetical protein
MIQRNVSSSAGLALLMALVISLALSGCAHKHAGKETGGSPPTTPTAPDAAVVIQIAPDGAIRVTDGAGRDLPECMLCDEAAQKIYGPNCSKDAATAARFCQGTVMATLENVTPIVALLTRGSPVCHPIIVGGKRLQGPCYCKAGDTPPPGMTCKYI